MEPIFTRRSPSLPFSTPTTQVNNHLHGVIYLPVFYLFSLKSPPEIVRYPRGLTAPQSIPSSPHSKQGNARAGKVFLRTRGECEKKKNALELVHRARMEVGRYIEAWHARGFTTEKRMKNGPPQYKMLRELDDAAMCPSLLSRRSSKHIC